MLKLVLVGAILVAAAMAQAAEVCVLESKSTLSKDPYSSNSGRFEYNYTALGSCTVPSDTIAVQYVRVDWVQAKNCGGYKPDACFTPSEMNVVELMAPSLAKAKVIQALLAKGYSLSTDNILVK